MLILQLTGRAYTTQVSKFILTSTSVVVPGSDFQMKYLNNEMSQAPLVCRASSIKITGSQHNIDNNTYDADKTDKHAW
jgi:hypothetical protein